MDGHKWENNYNCSGSPKGERGLSLTSGSPPQGSCGRKMSQSLESLVLSLYFGEFQRVGGNRDVTLKGHTQKSNMLPKPGNKQ